MGWIVMSLKLTHDTMYWSDVNYIKRYIENTESNKKKKAKKIGSIMIAGIQYMHNYIQGVIRQNAYDASNIIFSDSYWMRYRHEYYSKDDSGKKITPKIGNTYYINFGNNYGSELSYFHHGLCIGKYGGKILIVPMRTGKDVFSKSFHPTKNPRGDKKYRQALMTEGFSKDGILMINDLKYISPARIDKVGVKINNDILKEIQDQVFRIGFPNIKSEADKNIREIAKLNETIELQRKEIIELKAQNNNLNQKLNILLTNQNNSSIIIP